MAVTYPEGGILGTTMRQTEQQKTGYVNNNHMNNVRVQLITTRPIPKTKLRSPAEVVNYARSSMEDLDREYAKVILLDTKNQVLGTETISIGSLNASIVHPREAVTSAVLSKSASVVFLHNHPSGICEPSKEDNDITSTLSKAFSDLGIKLVDSIIIGKGCYYSFLEINPARLSNGARGRTHTVTTVSERRNRYIIAEPTPEFRANTNLVNKQLAEESHKGTSWEPEKRAIQEIEGFGQYVNEVYDNLKKYAKTEAQKEFLNSEMERFQVGFAAKYNARLSAKGQTMSSFITGPSNFPVRRAQKANVAEQNRYEEMIAYRDKAQTAILRELKKMAVEEAGGELEVMKKKLADAERNHEFMVKANVIVRKKIPDDQKVKEIIALGTISEKTAREILKPDFMGRVGFPAYALSNDTANIARMKDRIKEMEKKESTPSGDIEFPGGTIHDSREEDRIQIFFDKKPTQDTINKLKSEGWRWSPHFGAWQRKRTDMALNSARRILGLEAKGRVFASVKEQTKIDEEVSARMQKVIDIMKIYRDKGYTYEDLLVGLNVYYLKQSGYVMGSNLNAQLLVDDLKKSGYDNLKQLWYKIIVQAPEREVAIPPKIPLLYPAPQQEAELRWVYGTKDEKWHLVGSEDRDFVHGITKERMKLIGQEAAKAEYLSATLARAGPVPVQAVPVDNPELTEALKIIKNSIDIWYSSGSTLDSKYATDMLDSAIRKTTYKKRNGYPDLERLLSDLNKSGYKNVREWYEPQRVKHPTELIVPPIPKTHMHPAAIAKTTQDINQQYTLKLQLARSLEELESVKNEIAFLPLSQGDKNQLIDIFNKRYSILTRQLPFGISIPQKQQEKPRILSAQTPQQRFEEEQRKKAAEKRRTLGQKTLTSATSKRLSEFGIGERVHRYYSPQTRR